MNHFLPTEYSRFEIKISEETFTSSNNITYPKTATLQFYNANNIYINTIQCAFVDKNDIYDQIEQDKKIYLDECYIHNFSVEDYRALRGLKEKEPIELLEISAENAIFNTDNTTDFSYIKVKGNVNFKNSLFLKGQLNFHNLIVDEGHLTFANSLIKSNVFDFSNAKILKGKVSFKNSSFSEGLKDFQYTEFHSGEVEFVNTDFNKGNVSFINTYFGQGKISFKLSRFDEGNIDFHYSKFEGGDISFEKVQFNNGDFNFKMVELHKAKINFNRSIFGNGNKLFEGLSLQGKITFKKSILGSGKLLFELAELSDTDIIFDQSHIENIKISFNKANVKSLSFKGCEINNYLDLRVVKCLSIDLSNTVVRDIIDFKSHNFDVDIESINLSGMFLLGMIYIDWNINNVYQLIIRQENTSDAQKAEQFRILKENFNQLGRYFDEDQSYIWFKRFEAKNLLNKNISKNPVKNLYYYGGHWFKKIVFDYMGLYATNPIRVLLSTIITWLLFGVIYSGFLLFNWGDICSGIGGEHDTIGILGRSLYHSGVTFLTIGYGDFYPMGIIRGLSVLEGFIGVFMMSYFTVAFVRKILR